VQRAGRGGSGKEMRKLFGSRLLDSSSPPRLAQPGQHQDSMNRIRTMAPRSSQALNLRQLQCTCLRPSSFLNFANTPATLRASLRSPAAFARTSSRGFATEVEVPAEAAVVEEGGKPAPPEPLPPLFNCTPTDSARLSRLRNVGVSAHIDSGESALG
jgi:hypothetical protein